MSKIPRCSSCVYSAVADTEYPCFNCLKYHANCFVFDPRKTVKPTDFTTQEQYFEFVKMSNEDTVLLQQGLFRNTEGTGDMEIPDFYRRRTLTHAQLQQLSNILLGTSESIEGVVDRMGWLPFSDLIADQVNDFLMDGNIERCHLCDSWYFSNELIDDDNNVVGCSSCR